MNSIIKPIFLNSWNRPAVILTDLLTRSSESIFQASSSQSPIFKFTGLNLFWIAHYLYLGWWALRLAHGGLKDVFQKVLHHSWLLDESDYLLEILLQRNFLNRVICLCSVLLPLFAIYTYYVAYYKRFNYIWHTAAGFMLLDEPGFFDLNPQFIPKSLLKLRFCNGNFKKAALELISIVKAFWSLPTGWKIRFAHAQLPYYPNLPDRLRLRAQFINFTFNLFSITVMGGTFGCLLFLVALLTYLIVAETEESSWSNCIRAGIITESILVSIVTLTCLRNILFFLHILTLITRVSIYYMRYLDKQLALANRRVILNCKRLKQVKYGRIVNHCRLEYSRLLLDAICSNEQLISPIVFFAVASNFPLNIYLTVQIYFRPLTTRQREAGDLLLAYMILVLQVAITCVAGLALVTISKATVAPVKRLFRAQLYCTGKAAPPGQKVKLLSFLETIYSKQRFAFTLGPIARITTMFVAEFLVCYTDYMMSMFEFLIEESTQKIIENAENL